MISVQIGPSESGQERCTSGNEAILWFSSLPRFLPEIRWFGPQGHLNGQ